MIDSLQKYKDEFEVTFDSGRSYTDFTLLVKHKKTQKTYKVEDASNIILESFLENLLISIRDEKLSEILNP